ncbi:hypothetical protein ABPG75_002884 [Micractinium tetrahymenae]
MGAHRAVLLALLLATAAVRDASGAPPAPAGKGSAAAGPATSATAATAATGGRTAGSGADAAGTRPAGLPTAAGEESDLIGDVLAKPAAAGGGNGAAAATADMTGAAGGKAAIAAAGGGATKGGAITAGAAGTAPGASGAKAAPLEADGGDEAGAELSYDGPMIMVHNREEAEAAVEEGVKAQQRGKRKKVVSQLISQAKPAELPFGDDDIPINGPCKASIRKFCRKVEPGEGALASCLLEQMLAAEGDDSQHERLPRACADQLDSFMEAFTANVNANLPIAKQCKKDIAKLCSAVNPENEGAVLDCLRRQRKKLRDKCEALIFELEQATSDDYRLDRPLVDACKEEINRLCSQHIADPHGGEMQTCLLEHEGSLGGRCLKELFREEMQQGDDIRLSLGLLHACFDSKEKFCEGIAPGEVNVKDCLEVHMWEDGFDDDCRERLEHLIRRRSKYFRMDSVLRERCADDIVRLCGIADAGLVTGVDFLGDPIAGVEEQGVSICLQDRREDIRDPACQRRVQQVVAATFRDMRFNHPLAEACAIDRERLCASEPPGSASVLRCLARQRGKLSSQCAAKLFDTEVAMAENIDFNWPLKEACTKEIKKHCGGVEHGRGRVIRCLQHAAEEHADDFSDSCQQAVEAYEARAGTDYRLNFRLATACKDDIGRLCPNACGALERKTGCGGSVLQCLSNFTSWNGERSMQSEECKKEVRYFLRMRVRHFHNDVALAEACREDVEEFCEGERDDRILACLHSHRGRLSGPCRAEETRLDILQSQGIDLRPAVGKGCEEERRTHCSLVRPGRPGVLNCLLFSAAAGLDFGGACLEALDSLQERRVLDWRTDWRMMRTCGPDVDRHCAEANRSAGWHSVTGGLDGGVFTCLLLHHSKLEGGCASAVSRAAHTALAFYKPMRIGTYACDSDIAQLCPHDTSSDRPSPGVVRDCLAAHLEADRQAEAEAAGQAGSVPGYAGKGAAAVAAHAAGSERRRRLGERLAAAAAGSERSMAGSGRWRTEAVWRRKQQEHAAEAEAEGEQEQVAAAAAQAAVQVGEQQPEQTLSPSCRSFLDVALPADAYERFQDSMTATWVLTQLASIEARLGLPHGSLHNPAATAGGDVLTLTGWVALAGVFALATLVLALGVFLLRKHTGLGAPNAAARGYTMVIKHETELPQQQSANSPGGLPRRYG